jgi:hypothetical protein
MKNANRISHLDILALGSWMRKQSKDYIRSTPDRKLGEEAAIECKRERPFPHSTVQTIREHLGITKAVALGGPRMKQVTADKFEKLARGIIAIANMFEMDNPEIEAIRQEWPLKAALVPPAK